MAAYLIGEIEMITCKEDLMNTYIVKGNDALTKAYLNACKEYVNVYALDCDRWPEDFHLYFNPEFDHIQSGSCDTSKYKEITLKDLVKTKPTKFVKVEESIFDLKEEFEMGELYVSTCEGHYTQILGENGLFLAVFNDSIYRQVEIDWRDEVEKHRYVLNAPYYSMRNDPDKFIAMCHAIAELTDKPE
jgi:hypothetical protein